MSTTTKTSGSNQSSLQFNPAAQAMYNQLIQGGGNQLNQMINNPFGNPLYRTGLDQTQIGAAQQAQNNMRALNQNQLVQGLGGQAGQGWMNAQRAQTGRANASMMAQGNTANVMNALSRQMAATGMGMSFSPQLTGQTGNFNQTQTSGGLGSWLPQLMGAGLNAGMSAMTGGMSSAIKGATSGIGGFTNAGSAPSFPGFPALGGAPSTGGGNPLSFMNFNPTMPSFGGGK